jgi:hypothetical protein
LGTLPYNIPADKIEVLRDRKADRVDSANGRLRALRGLFAYALSDKSIPLKRNPAKESPISIARKRADFTRGRPRKSRTISIGMEKKARLWATSRKVAAINTMQCGVRL